MKEPYFKRLKKHPGLGFGFIITIALVLAGASNESFEHWYHGAAFGGCVSVIFPWSIVLISN